MGKYDSRSSTHTADRVPRRVHVFPELDPFHMRQPITLTVAPAHSAQSTGAIVWGLEGTSHYLFASSESSGGDDNYTGFHRAFDLNKATFAYQFDANEAGDAIALSPNGKISVTSLSINVYTILQVNVSCFLLKAISVLTSCECMMCGERIIALYGRPSWSHSQSRLMAKSTAPSSVQI